MSFGQAGAVGGAVLVAAAGVYVALLGVRSDDKEAAPRFERPFRNHVNHAAFFPEPFASPQEVTRACLRCHPDAAREMMQTAHWLWLGQEVKVPGHDRPLRIGKANVINNFCLTTIGNRAACTKCHAGYGWDKDPYDFTRAENVDCLVCHEWSGTYVKGEAGMPAKGVDLQAVAKTVGYPKRENCSVCHSYGGGGQAVKHGDIDSTLENPTPFDDVHMGKLGFLCIDCHKTEKHNVRGRAFSVSVEDSNGFDCTTCHQDPPHKDPRINTHLSSVACQTCHIPTFARRVPTKTFWDWSKAGDMSREDDPHHYLKIKGEFVYDQDVVPEYFWFDKTVDRYILDDPMDPSKITDINRPRGDIHNPNAKIWPFKVHLALQPYDKVRNVLLPPILSGEGGYWHDFDWDKALRLGAKAASVEYSGQYGFAKTAQYWPLSHMVTPADKALRCNDCHGEGKRMNWAALGYPGDPIVTGGRR